MVMFKSQETFFSFGTEMESKTQALRMTRAEDLDKSNESKQHKVMD